MCGGRDVRNRSAVFFFASYLKPQACSLKPLQADGRR